MSGNPATKHPSASSDESAPRARPLPRPPLPRPPLPPPPVPPPRREETSSSSSSLTRPTVAAPDEPKPNGVKWRMAEPYKLLKRIRGDSLLFEGKNSNTSRRVIIQLVSGDDEATLMKRVHLARRLRHPNTARLLDAGVVTAPVRVGYLVREYVAGETLETHLQKHQLSHKQSLELLRQVLNSLAEAHALGLHHGRLSPEHVLVTSDGTLDGLHAKVIGYWTLANHQSEESGEYVAPDANPSVGQDLYAAAALLLRCLTGSNDVRSVEQLATEDEQLGAVIARALSDDPIDGYPSVEHFRQAIAECNRGDAMTDAGSWLPACSRTAPRLMPSKRSLMSTRASSIWVLDGDPAISSPCVEEAIARLRKRHPVRIVAQSERELLANQLLQQDATLPWIVVFGGMSVLVDDPLLRLLGTSVEVSRLLVSSHDNLELLQDAITQGGLDGHVSLPGESDDLVAAVESLMTVTKRLNNHYDAIRLALRKAHDQVDKLSHAIAANETGVSKADSVSQLRALAGGEHE